ncbi:YdcF family protein [Synechococcus sp. CB0101]|uniref:YdcF family protein n=1 Tax=Synechococcus sp. CB0101 TaxID=232348 RepID=UPI0009FF362D|nr:YdcF family protein [Synechococcus sp. CB0101]QCH14414.1 YdcF family protein [Synechococcus sp. CB0101]
MPIEWQTCPPDPLLWIQWREPLLQLLFTPWLLLPLVAIGFGLVLCLLPWSLPWPWRALLLTTLVLLSSGIYSPAATDLMSRWLTARQPDSAVTASHRPLPLAVLLGRGPQIAQATTAEAARQLNSNAVAVVYVSGHQPSTAQRLLRLGVPPERVAGDSCARTTWENATHTSLWLQRHYPGAAVLLITDPWQLPRAARAFAHQGLTVWPLAVEPRLSARERNRLALRETAGTLLYALQGRM